MKALLQNFRNGELSVSEVPPPSLRAGGILVQNVASLVSAGTEKAIIELAKMNPLQKARARPDLVQKLLRRMGQEGLIATAQTVMNLINAPIPLGYSCAGIVREIGAGVRGIQVGDAVACAGLGHANHSEMVFIPQNLAVRVPKGVEFDEAAFVTVGAIAMQGVRQADLRVGENVVVLGLGLVGQLAAQICSASGCRVFGIDVDSSKVRLAQELGAYAGGSPGPDAEKALHEFTGGRGADAIMITAATKSNQPIELAAKLARDRARIIIVGDVKIDIPRREYYEKELEIKLSRSYGPGRYDPAYEEKGQDYPIGYVRWTENRNMEAFLGLVAQRKLDVKQLITHRFAIESAQEAYNLLGGNRKEPFIAILLNYDANAVLAPAINLKPKRAMAMEKTIGFGVIGAGQFAQGVLLPRLAKMKGVAIQTIVTGSGVTARAVADKYQCRSCASDYREVLADESIQAVLIATQHHLHAQIAADSLAQGKHVFVEKPLAINEEGLGLIAQTIQKLGQENKNVPILMVGYNRRFSPLALKMKQFFHRAPLILTYRINAGIMPKDHWTQDPERGGGRIVGEICHFIDVMQFLTDSEIAEVFAWPLGIASEMPESDNLCAQLRFKNGSIGTITYFSSGHDSFPKERLEVFGGGAAGCIDNWRTLELFGRKQHIKESSLLSSKKGFLEELESFVAGIRTGESPIALESLLSTTRTTFAIQDSLRQGVPIVINPT